MRSCSCATRALDEVASIVNPDRILGWHRRLVAKKFDSLMVQKLSRSSSAAVSDFGYDACDEHICLATNLPGLAPGVLALFTVGDVYVSLCKKGTYAPYSAQRRS